MSDTAIRWGGLSLIVGVAFLGLAVVMVSFTANGDLPLFNVALLLSGVLLLLSFPAMYAKQARAAGWLGLAGHTLLQTGTLLFVVVASMTLRFPSFHPPASAGNAVDFLLGVAFTLGLLLTSIATIRARVFPLWAGILLLAGTAGFFFAFFIAELLPPLVGQVGNAVLGTLLLFALAWIGAAMLRGNYEHRQSNERSTAL